MGLISFYNVRETYMRFICFCLAWMNCKQKDQTDLRKGQSTVAVEFTVKSFLQHPALPPLDFPPAQRDPGTSLEPSLIARNQNSCSLSPMQMLKRFNIQYFKMTQEQNSTNLSNALGQKLRLCSDLDESDDIFRSSCNNEAICGSAVCTRIVSANCWTSKAQRGNSTNKSCT